MVRVNVAESFAHVAEPLVDLRGDEGEQLEQMLLISVALMPLGVLGFFG